MMQRQAWLKRRAHPLACAALLLAVYAVATVTFAAEAPSPLPLRTGGSVDLWQTAFKAVVVAVLSLSLVAVALYTWRHRIRLRTGQLPITGVAAGVEWARRVSPRTTLLVVRWQGRQYLLAENGASTQVIDSKVIGEPHA